MAAFLNSFVHSYLTKTHSVQDLFYFYYLSFLLSYSAKFKISQLFSEFLRTGMEYINFSFLLD